MTFSWINGGTTAKIYASIMAHSEPAIWLHFVRDNNIFGTMDFWQMFELS